MSPESNVELDTGEGDIGREIELQAYNLAQYQPGEVKLMEDIDPRIKFRASQLGMLAARDWQTRAEWVGVYLGAIQPCDDI